MIRARRVVVQAPRRLVLETFDLDPSRAAGDDVFAETLMSAISPGTELAAFTGAPPLRPSVQYPRLVGYCNVARVISVGADVRGLELGSRILTFSAHCSHFRIPHRDVLATLPPDVADDAAVVAYLYHLGYAAVLRSDLRLGASVVVIGLGVLGLTSTQLAAKAGAAVFVVSDHEASRALAQRLGARAGFARAQVGDLLATLGPDLANVVISTSNAWSDWTLALRSAGERGTIAVLGFPGRGTTGIPGNPLDSQYFYQKQLSILAAGLMPERPESRGFLPYNERRNLATILEWIRREELLPAALVAGVLPGDQIEDAYLRLLSGAGAPGTLLLQWGDGSPRRG